MAKRKPWTERDHAAIEQYYESNLGLVASMITRFVEPSVRLYLGDSLYDYGNDGLLRACIGFKPELGFKFSTYACRAIIRSLRQGIAREMKKRMATNCGERVFERTETEESVSLREERHSMVNETIDSLPPHYQEVLRQRYFRGLLFAPMAIELGITKQGAHLRTQRALEAFRKAYLERQRVS
jgi:RNA polymerase sigma factor (sigma-70 family)